MNTRRRIIDTSPKGAELLTKYKDEVRMLAGVVIEMVVDEPKLLLSPYMRQILADKAKEVRGLHSKLEQHLCVDYLHSD